MELLTRISVIHKFLALGSDVRLVGQQLRNFKFGSQSNRNTYRDLLDCAVKLNEIVDFTWSAKRINVEHLRQIRLLKQQEISEKSNKPIYEHTIGNDTIKQLNTEIDVYMEGMAMNHCLYSCYYDRIASKKYIAFHMTTPEDCTFSIRKTSSGFEFDQIYLKYDMPVQSETKAIAEQFIKDNSENISKMFEEQSDSLVNNCIDLQW